MKERPILFSAPMVRAILEGRKTQTRRIVKPQPSLCGLRQLTPGDIAATGLDSSYWYGADPFTEAVKCPYGIPGDRLWVKETYGMHYGFVFRATHEGQVTPSGGWKPSIFMPRHASRITLEIEAVRVERLIEISEEDVWEEGVSKPSGYFGCPGQAQGEYRKLWESVNGAGSWDANPYVWVIQFRRLQ